MYEAAAWSAVAHACDTDASCAGRGKLVLTMLGAGVFGNPEEWIAEAMESALQILHSKGIEIEVVVNLRTKREFKNRSSMAALLKTWKQSCD